MTYRNLWVVAAFLVVGFTVDAQQVDHTANLNSLHRGSDYVPSLALSDAHAFPFSSSFAWMEAAPNNFLPNWKPDNWDNGLNMAQTAPQRRARSSSSAPNGDSKDFDSSGASVELHKNLFDYVHGEVGFLYGHSAGGRNSASTESAFINATTGNDKVQISVGAFYENTNFDLQRRGR
jgi:hypothetical protein